MNESSFRKEILIDGYNVDFSGAMTVGAMMRHAQTVSCEHCMAVGYGDDYMASIERVFLLVRAKVDIPRTPLLAQRVMIETTAYAPDRIIYPRITSFFSPDGELLARIDSRWVLVDTVKLRIARRAPDGFAFPVEPVCPEPDFKMPTKHQGHAAETVRVRYSMVDCNGHLNNAAYADIVLNALERRLVAGERVGRFTIAYHNEAKLGAEIALSVYDGADGVQVSGSLGETACFDACVEFALY